MLENKYTLRDATLDDAHRMAPLMRQVDIDEIKASHGHEPLEALIKAVQSSDVCRTWLVDGEPACMLGVNRHTLMGDTAFVWLLGTDKLQQHQIHFLRGCKGEMDHISKGLTRLENWCDARNKVTLRWLKWFGFTIEEAKPYGIYEMLFHHFYKEIN